MKKMSRWVVFALGLLAIVGLTLVGRELAEGDGLTLASPQLVTSLAVSQNSHYIYQYRFEAGFPTLPWISGNVLSGVVGDIYGHTGSGDIDNDTFVEVFAVVDKLIRTQKIDKRTTIAFYTQELAIYESESLPGATPAPTFYDIRNTGEDGARGAARACVVANVDGDGYQELVVQYGSGLAVYQLVNGVLTTEWETPETFEYSLDGLAVGDVDGCKCREIVSGNLTQGAPVIFKYNGAGFTYSLGQLCTIYAKGTQATNVLDPKLGDLDNDGKDEIVSGGRNYRVMVWDYVDGQYKLAFTSPSLGYLTFANIGDVNGDGNKELIACNMGNLGKRPYLWIFASTGSQYTLKSQTEIAYSGAAEIEIANLDTDAKDEVIISLAGLIKFYRFIGSDLTASAFSEYASVTGSLCEIR